MEKSTVSVVIPCHKQAGFLRLCLESVFRQTRCPDEVIVIESGNDIADRVQIFAVVQCTPAILISIAERKNAAAARNIGLRLASSDYFLPLDADDMLEEGFIAKVLAAAAPDRIVRTGARMFRAGELEGTADPDSIRLWKPSDSGRLDVLAQRGQAFSASLLPAEAARRVRGYDEQLEGYEDWELTIRLVKAGLSIATVNEPLLQYRQHEASKFKRSCANDAVLRAYIRNKHPDLYGPAGKR